MGAIGTEAAALLQAALNIGALAFVHRFGSSLNGHVHFHVCVLDGVFEEMPGRGETDAQLDYRSHRCQLAAATHIPGARTTVVG